MVLVEHCGTYNANLLPMSVSIEKLACVVVVFELGNIVSVMVFRTLRNVCKSDKELDFLLILYYISTRKAVSNFLTSPSGNKLVVSNVHRFVFLMCMNFCF